MLIFKMKNSMLIELHWNQQEKEKEEVPLQIAPVGLPPPILVPQIRPPMLVTRQLVRHVRTLRLLVQWIRGIIKHPFARSHVASLRCHSPPLTVITVNPSDFPTTIVSGGVALTESIQNLWNQTNKNFKSTEPSKETNSNIQ